MRNAFKGAHYGFFFHFLNTGDSYAPPLGKQAPSKIEQWDQKVDDFDVDNFARQLHELKAAYAFITIGQNSGYYCSPNSRYDGLLGARRTSKRDLISDFADALEKYGIDLYVYTTSMCPMGDELAIEKLQALPPWNSNKNYGNYESVKHLRVDDPRLKFFMNAWNDIHREWSLRWGKKVKGWWVDGCYFPREMYDFPDEPNGHSFTAALRAGNPDSVVALNPGAAPPPRRNYAGDDEDYTGGEINNPALEILKGPEIDGLKYHILTYVGSTWGRGPVRGTGEDLAAMTRNITDTGGVVSWDIPFTTKGIDDDLFKVLADFRDSYWASLDKFPPIYTEIVPPIDGRPGSLKVEAGEPCEMTMGWNGSTTSINVPCVCELSGAARGESILSIEKNGFTRKFPVWCGAKTVDLSDGQPLVLDNGGNAIFTLKKGNDGELLVTADVTEKESRPGSKRAPWGGSVLEIYMHEMDGRRRQLAVQPDGTMVTVFPEYLEMDAVPVDKTKKGYKYTFSLKGEGGSFKLELRMQTFTGTEGSFLPVNLFGGIASGSTRMDLHATIILDK